MNKNFPKIQIPGGLPSPVGGAGVVGMLKLRFDRYITGLIRRGPLEGFRLLGIQYFQTLPGCRVSMTILTWQDYLNIMTRSYKDKKKQSIHFCSSASTSNKLPCPSHALSMNHLVASVRGLRQAHYLYIIFSPTDRSCAQMT